MQSAEDHAETASPCWEGNKSEGKGHQGNCSHPLFISASLFSLVTNPTQLSCVELAWNKAEPEQGKSHPAPQDLAVSAMWKKSGVSDPWAWPIWSHHKGSSVGWEEEKCCGFHELNRSPPNRESGWCPLLSYHSTHLRAAAWETCCWEASEHERSKLKTPTELTNSLVQALPSNAILCSSSSPSSSLGMSSVEARWYFLHLLPGTWLHIHQGAGWLAGHAGLQGGSTLQRRQSLVQLVAFGEDPPSPTSPSQPVAGNALPWPTTSGLHWVWDSSGKAAASTAGSPACQAAANEPCTFQGCRRGEKLWAASGLGWNSRSWWLVKASWVYYLSARDTCPKASLL